MIMHDIVVKTPIQNFVHGISSHLNILFITDQTPSSIKNRSAFFNRLFSWTNLIHEESYNTVVDESAPVDAVPLWFPGVRINWAENILFSRNASDPKGHRGAKGKENDKIAVTQIREGNTEVQSVTWAELRHDAGRLASALQVRGVQQGDRSILIGANSIDTLLVFLATTWLGAIFSSVSTDMGVKGILQRALQINPNSCTNLSGIVAIPRFDKPFDVSSMPGFETLSSLLYSTVTTTPPFVRIPFHSPFLICYSSGTTGNSEAIVHSVGGVLLNLLKEGRLHESTSADSVALQYTTISWIMYVLQVAALLQGARVILYDGSPLMPYPTTFIKILAEQRVTKFGTSPRWMSEIAKNRISPRGIVDLSALQVVTSTGMALSDEMFEWFYDVGFPRNVHLINMSGGTAIAGCFGAGNPLTPVYMGGNQGPSLGVPVSVYDSQIQEGTGAPVSPGIAGELVVTAAFPNMPCFFWGDSSLSAAAPPGSKYHPSYFGRFEHVWTHGNFCVVHPKMYNIHFLGRSDGVLNPSGVRFGSSEIYAVIEAGFSDQVSDNLCVGQKRPGDSDESVMLLLLMRKGRELSRGLIKKIQSAIAKELSKRHVPKYIFEAPEIPMTINLKKLEVPVKQIVSDHTIKPSNTLINPQSLEFYYQFARVEELGRGPERLQSLQGSLWLRG